MPPINLSPLVFQKILRFAKPNKELKLTEVDDFITNHGGPKRLLTYFSYSFSRVKINVFQFYIDFLKDPFMEFAWLFARTLAKSPQHIFSLCPICSF